MTAPRFTTAVTVAALLGASLSIAPAALAKSGGGVRTSGTCSAGAVWKLKVKTEDAAGLEVEAEIDSNVVGQNWAWNLRDNNILRASGTARTTAPSGSFTVARRVPDRVGVDHILFTARHAGQTCLAAASL